MSIVSLARCGSYEAETVEKAVTRAVELLGGMRSFVKQGNRVLLKPNLLSAKARDRRITTDPAVVRAVAKMVLEAGGRPQIGDSPAIDSFRRVAMKTGMAEVARELGIELVELSDPVTISLPPGSRFRKLEIASQALGADVVINLPKLKTHSQMLMTLGVKNLFGTIVAQRKAEWHHMAGVDRDTFASLLLEIYRSVGPALTVLDGVWGMEGHGPSNGTPCPVNMIAASRDAVALDVAVCHLLGVPLRTFPVYRVAKARGIGQTDLDQIIFKGDLPDSLRVRNFQVPELDSLHILPGLFDWFTRRFLVSKPVHRGENCIGCGQCAQVCPADAVEVNGRKVRFHYDGCIRCYCCQEICPENAICFRKGMLVRILNRFNR